MGYKKGQTSGRQKGVPNLKRKIDAESGKLGYINKEGVFFTDREKDDLEKAVRKANKKSKEMREIFDALPYKIQGRETGATVGEMRTMGKELDFSIAPKTASLQRFKSHKDFDRYMANLERVNADDYVKTRSRQYKSNYTKALLNPEGGLGLAYDDVSDIVMKIRTMKTEEYLQKVASNEELEIGYLYDEDQLEAKLNAIRSALGLQHRELESYWDGDEY